MSVCVCGSGLGRSLSWTRDAHTPTIKLERELAQNDGGDETKKKEMHLLKWIDLL
jgi:hypothetical protein